MSKRISDGLREFLKAWLKWAESGARQHEVFSRDKGLCCLVLTYYRDNSPYFELREIFNRFQDPCFPFGGEERYYKDSRECTTHKNTLRLAWVRKTLGIKPKGKTTAAPKTKPAERKASEQPDR